MDNCKWSAIISSRMCTGLTQNVKHSSPSSLDIFISKHQQFRTFLPNWYFNICILWGRAKSDPTICSSIVTVNFWCKLPMHDSTQCQSTLNTETSIHPNKKVRHSPHKVATGHHPLRRISTLTHRTLILFKYIPTLHKENKAGKNIKVWANVCVKFLGGCLDTICCHASLTVHSSVHYKSRWWAVCWDWSSAM